MTVFHLTGKVQYKGRFRPCDYASKLKEREEEGQWIEK